MILTLLNRICRLRLNLLNEPLGREEMIKKSMLLVLMLTFFYARKEWKTYLKRNLLMDLHNRHGDRGTLQYRHHI